MQDLTIHRYKSKPKQNFEHPQTRPTQMNGGTAQIVLNCYSNAITATPMYSRKLTELHQQEYPHNNTQKIIYCHNHHMYTIGNPTAPQIHPLFLVLSNYLYHHKSKPLQTNLWVIFGTSKLPSV